MANALGLKEHRVVFEKKDAILKALTWMVDHLSEGGTKEERRRIIKEIEDMNREDMIQFFAELVGLHDILHGIMEGVESTLALQHGVMTPHLMDVAIKNLEGLSNVPGMKELIPRIREAIQSQTLSNPENHDLIRKAAMAMRNADDEKVLPPIVMNPHTVH